MKLSELVTQTLIAEDGTEIKIAVIDGRNQVVRECPGCSGLVIGAYCTACDGLILEGMPSATSYQMVRGSFDPKANEVQAAGEARYFDISGPGYRRHGWYNPSTKLLVQVG